MMRLNKYLRETGFCSRREADRLIADGEVTVDGNAAVLGMQVEDGQEIRVRGSLVPEPKAKVVLAVNKPAGAVCTEDPKEKDNIFRLLDLPRQLTYAGRLDKDSEGLLLLTNDGDLIDHMMRARYAHEKEYDVTADHPITEEFLEKMRSGVRIRDDEKGLDVVTRPCKVWQTGTETFSMILTQGFNRQIRRMCEALGYRVKKLVRVRVMNVSLGDLETGQTRWLTKEEQRKLYRMAGMDETKELQDDTDTGAAK